MESRIGASRIGKAALRLTALGALVLVASCTTPPPPPPPPPPAPAPTPTPTPVPYRPQPPGGASFTMAIPPLDPNGVRLTVNTGLTTAGTTWNLRSGLNVAALNCLQPQHAPILAAYRDFLKKNEKKLAATNKAIEAEFRKAFDAKTYRTERDGYMTKVYNYFALPPAREEFCTAATRIAEGYIAAPPADLDAYAAVTLPQLEAVFLDFFNRYDAYRVAAAQWDAQYGALYGHTQPGYVAPPAAPITITLPSVAGVPQPGAVVAGGELVGPPASPAVQ